MGPCGEYKYEVSGWSPNEEKSHISQCKRCKNCRDWMFLCKRKDSCFQSLRDIKRATYICSKHFEGNPEKLDFQVHRPKSSISEPSVPRRKWVDRRQTDVETVIQVDSASTSTAIAQSGDLDWHDVSVDFSMPSPLQHQLCEEMDVSEETGLEQIPTATFFTASTNTIAPIMVDVGIQVNISMTSKSCQTTYKLYDISQLQDKISQLKAQIIEMKAKVSKAENSNFSINDFSEKVLSKSKMCKFYTGFDVETYFMIKEFVVDDNHEVVFWEGSSKSSETSGNRRPSKKFKNLTVDAQLMLFFLRVRRGLVLQDIAYRFGLDNSDISKIVTTWVQHMYSQFDTLRTPMFASRDIIKEHLPARFKQLKNIRIIIDCAEFICERPSNFEQQGNCYSQYKAHPTFKVLLGCSPNGGVMFVSDLFEGSISDREIVDRSGLIDRLEEGDLVLADRGFTIKDLTDKKKAILKIPAFLRGRDCLTPQEEIDTKIIAANRIFVEHVVGRLKNFKLLQRVIPLKMRHILSQIVFVCACLLNFNPPSVQ